MPNTQATPAHQAFRDDAIKLLAKHAGALTALEMLALAGHMVGQIIALQDQRTTSPEMAMKVVSMNIELGNAEALREIQNPLGRG